MDIDTLKIGFLQMPDKSVYLPGLVEYFLSDDGNSYIKAAEVLSPKSGVTDTLIYRFPAEVDRKARFVKVKANRADVLPDGSPAEKKLIWMITDEIIVE